MEGTKVVKLYPTCQDSKGQFCQSYPKKKTSSYLPRTATLLVRLKRSTFMAVPVEPRHRSRKIHNLLTVRLRTPLQRALIDASMRCRRPCGTFSIPHLVRLDMNKDLGAPVILVLDSRRITGIRIQSLQPPRQM